MSCKYLLSLSEHSVFEMHAPHSRGGQSAGTEHPEILKSALESGALAAEPLNNAYRHKLLFNISTRLCLLKGKKKLISYLDLQFLHIGVLFPCSCKELFSELFRFQYLYAVTADPTWFPLVSTEPSRFSAQPVTSSSMSTMTKNKPTSASIPAKEQNPQVRVVFCISKTERTARHLWLSKLKFTRKLPKREIKETTLFTHFEKKPFKNKWGSCQFVLCVCGALRERGESTSPRNMEENG